MTLTSTPEQPSGQITDKTAIRPFRFQAANAELDEMRRRIKATRWPEKETVADTSQGVPLATLQDLVCCASDCFPRKTLAPTASMRVTHAC
jgi:hypothetical protein